MHVTTQQILGSVACFLIGLTLIVFAKRIGLGFCRVGKVIWKMMTFGLTDMHWFYREESAPTTFRVMGVILMGISILLLIPIS